MAEKNKVLVFHPAIAPYRIRFFNEISRAFDATICLYYKNLKSQKFDYDEIEKQFLFSPHYFKKSVQIGHRSIYIGHSEWIKHAQPDAIVVSEYGAGLWAAIFARACSRKKYKVLTICDDSMEMAEKRKGLRKIVRNVAVRHIDGLILCNEEAGNWYSKFSVPLFVFPIIQNEHDFYKDRNAAEIIATQLIDQYKLKGKRVFLYVGRLSPEKNLAYLIKSFIHQHDKHPENTLFIVGGVSTTNPEYEDKLQAIIHNGAAENYIRLVGHKEGIELKAWYYLGQVLILPSSKEAFGAVVNEALLAGEYVLVSKAAGACCLVTMNNGEVIDIEKPFIELDSISSIVRPLENIQIKRANMMPFSFESKMNGLISWINNMLGLG